MLVPWLTSLDGATRRPLFSIGDRGAWSDLTLTTRWGDGACGNFELKWSMPLPADFEHPLLRRGTLVELMDGPYRVGSPFVLSEPAVGSGFDDPWQFVATGMGREVEGSNSFYAADGAGNASTVLTTVVDQAIVDGWRISGRDASIPATSPNLLGVSEGLNTVGDTLAAGATAAGKRWGVGQDNLVKFISDPTTPTYQTVPNAVALGRADDDYASTVKVRYLDSSDGTYKTRPATNANVAAKFGVRQAMEDVTDRNPMSLSAAQNIADQFLALTKGRLSWTNKITVTANQLLTIGGTPADLGKVAEDVGNGCMVRVQGIWSDLLEYNGQTWLDLIMGEAVFVDGQQTIDLSPIGLAPRDFAAIIESLAGPAAA